MNDFRNYGVLKFLVSLVKGREFKNVIFDLGGVIINLNEKSTVERFAQISNVPPTVVQQHLLHFDAYKLFEKGLISSEDFRQEVRKEFDITATDETIDECMNAMLLDIPEERINLLKSLRNRYRLFLLSNTNHIHYTCFNQIVRDSTHEKNLDVFFEKAYYSQLVHMRKPDAEIFELVLADNNLKAEETLFLDDNLTNIKGAEQLGIQTFHVKNPDQLIEFFA